MAEENTQSIYLNVLIFQIYIDFLIDKKNLHEINGYLVKKPNKENLKGLDVIVISSFSHQEDIKQELMQQNLDCELITLYSEEESFPFYRQQVLTNNNVNKITDIYKIDDLIRNIDCKYFVKYHLLKKKYNLKENPCPINKYDDTGIVIQGPIKYEDDFTYESIKYYMAIFPGCKIILSTWDEEAQNDKFELFRDLEIDILLNKKPEYLNLISLHTINFQLLSSYNGLCKLKELGITYALKIRSDMRINSIYFLDTVKRLNELYQTIDYSKQICRLTILPTILSIKNQKYMNYIHDYLMFGHIEDMLEYWKYPISKDEIDNSFKLSNTNPERVLAYRYQKNIGLNYTTFNQYLDNLYNYFIIIDIDDFNVYWGKYNYGDLANTNNDEIEYLTAYEWMCNQFNTN